MIPPPHQVPDAWDFYLCRVDDGPASITLNFWYRDVAPIPGLDTLYWCRISMREPDEHGMGSAPEAKRLNRIEDAVYERAETEGLYPVGRLRSRGRWQLALYGPEGKIDRLDAIAAEVMRGDATREVETGEREDADWCYFTDFLCPDEERGQWIQNRHVVEALMEKGDDPSRPRRVDHWIYFAERARRDAFVEATRGEGFALESAPDDAEPPRPHAAQIHRTEPVALSSIHATVMHLIALAREHDGDYDGWETSVEA